MAEFKFSCPQCGQRIQCDTGYAGVQIACPGCQQTITVPQAPASAAAPPAPPGLSTRQSTSVAASGRRFASAPGAQPAAPPKSRALRNVLIITTAIVVLAALGAGGWFGYTKYKAVKAKQEAAKGNPAAQVPMPTAVQSAGALDILTKVHQAYTGLASLNVSGTSVSVIDLSAVTAADLNPNQSTTKKKTTRRPAGIPKAMTNTTDVVIKLARPDLYCIEGTMAMEAGRNKMTNTIATWSQGGTNFVLMFFGGGSYKNFMTVPDRRAAFMMNGQAGGLAMAIPQLFFDETEVMNNLIKEWGQTDDEAVDGQDCYTLTGKIMGQKLKIWVSKDSYMILQSQITLGAPISDTDIEAATSTFDTNTNKTQAQLNQEKVMAKQQAAMMTKIRGTITETYDNIQTNETFTADDFNYPVPRGVRLTASPFAATTQSGSSLEARQRNTCINNLRQIDAAKNQWALENGKKAGDLVTEADIQPYLTGGKMPTCPSGGTYTIGKVGENPTCSIPGHVLP